jgi:hypothetical protein
MNEKLKKDRSTKRENDQERFYQEKIQKRYVHNVIGVTQVKVTRVVLKAPSNIYNPSFSENVGLWEQYWDAKGNKLFEQRISDDKAFKK